MGFSPKSYGHICNPKLDKVIEFIDSNKKKNNIKNMCTVLGVARSTYYKYFCKTKSVREIENEELKKAIIRIYKVNKGIYGVPRIHYILCKEGFKVIFKESSKKDEWTFSLLNNCKKI